MRSEEVNIKHSWGLTLRLRAVLVIANNLRKHCHIRPGELKVAVSWKSTAHFHAQDSCQWRLLSAAIGQFVHRSCGTSKKKEGGVLLSTGNIQREPKWLEGGISLCETNLFPFTWKLMDHKFYTFLALAPESCDTFRELTAQTSTQTWIARGSRDESREEMSLTPVSSFTLRQRGFGFSYSVALTCTTLLQCTWVMPACIQSLLPLHSQP